VKFIEKLIFRAVYPLFVIRTISEIRKEQRQTTKQLVQYTRTRYKRQVHYLKKQYDLLYELLVNYFEYGTLYCKNSDQFILCYALFAEMLKKQRMSTDLILSGYYDEAAELARHMMQSLYHLIYLVKYSVSWKDWQEQQKYEQDKLASKFIVPLHVVSQDYFNKFVSLVLRNWEKATFFLNRRVKEITIAEYNKGLFDIAYTKNPRTIFASRGFKELLICINEEAQYRVYQKLCSWSHPSIEVMRSSLELGYEGIQKHYFVPRFDENKCEGLLSLLYGFVNEAFWKGFKDLIERTDEVPAVMKKYKLIQKRATLVFDKFYVVID